jgi:hypothetical protein
MKRMVAVLIAGLVGLQVAGGTTRKTVPQYKAESSAYVVEHKEGWTFITDNHSFRFAEVLGDNGSYEALLLLEESYHNERTDSIEGVRGNATVRAWTLKAGRHRELRWTFQESGNEGLRQDRFFRVLAWGCCDMPPVYSYYSLLTGKVLYVSNSELLEVRGDGEGPLASRYLAFGYGMDKLSQFPQLQYGTDKRVAQRFCVLSSREYYDSPQIFISTSAKLEKSLDLSSSQLTFTIVLRYNDGVELRIPVEADTVRPEKATLPAGYTLREEK